MTYRSQTFSLTCLAALLLGGCDQKVETADAPKEVEGSAVDITLSCGGTEPFWDIQLAGDEAHFKTMEGETRDFRLVSSETVDGRLDYLILKGEDMEGEGGGATLTLQRTGQCSDGMSDFVYDYEIVLDLSDGPSYAGCCGRLE